MFSLIEARRNAMLDTFTAGIGASPTLRIYDNSVAVPANADTTLPIGSVLLGTCTFSATPFPAASAGSITANTITQDDMADATGTAAYFRILNAAGTITYAQGLCGVSGSDLNLNTVDIVIGGPIAITSLIISI